MKNEISVYINGDEFLCREFFDSDTSIGGIDIYLDNVHLGEIYALFIPTDENENNLDYQHFNKTVENFLIDIYY